MHASLIKIGLLFGLILIAEARAADIYGLDLPTTQKIAKKYASEIEKLELALQKQRSQFRLGKAFDKTSTKIEQEIIQRTRVLTKKMTKDNGFLYVDIDMTLFPDDDFFFTNIEIIDKHHPERLRFLNPARKKNYPKKRGHKPDIFDAMIAHTAIAFTLVGQYKLSALYSPCPVYHCLLGFKHPKLKPYLKLFNTAAVKQKKQIIETLRQDPDRERRAAAAFLVGHFRDPHEILSVLIPYVTDQDDGVRNATMRVIAATLAKSKITNIPVDPFLDLLDSPYTSDRNKALWVLSNLATSKASHQRILQQSGEKLITLLRLKLPNNHDFAYAILKQISGEDFGSTNVEGWAKWVASAQRKATQDLPRNVNKRSSAPQSDVQQ